MENLLQRLGFQRSAVMHAVFFSVVSAVSAGMGIHTVGDESVLLQPVSWYHCVVVSAVVMACLLVAQCRHLVALLEACQSAIMHGFDAAVSCAALHLLHVLMVTCWPRFTGSVRQSTKPLAACFRAVFAPS
jgi:hypothetical protein